MDMVRWCSPYYLADQCVVKHFLHVIDILSAPQLKEDKNHKFKKIIYLKMFVFEDRAKDTKKSGGESKLDLVMLLLMMMVRAVMMMMMMVMLEVRMTINKVAIAGSPDPHFRQHTIASQHFSLADCPTNQLHNTLYIITAPKCNILHPTRAHHTLTYKTIKHSSLAHHTPYCTMEYHTVAPLRAGHFPLATDCPTVTATYGWFVCPPLSCQPLIVAISLHFCHANL